jgi:hypothetical protein
MHVTFLIWRPVALGAPELIVIVIILLVFFSAPVMPAENHPRKVCSRLVRGEARFLICLGVVLAVSIGVVLMQGFSR